MNASIKYQPSNCYIFFCYILLPFLFFGLSPFSTVNLGGKDSFFFMLPAKIFMAKSLRMGEIPFWNPYTLCGTPFLADLENGIFYPFNWLHLLMPSPIAQNLNLLLHYSAAGFFTFLYLAYLNCNRMAAFLGGLAFMFCGFMVGHKVHVNMIQAVAWLPLILLLFEKQISAKCLDLKLVINGGVIFALQLLAGHPQTSVLTGLFIFWRLFFIFLKSRQLFFVLFRSLLLGILVAIGLSAVQILPTYFFHFMSFRTKMSFNFFASNSLHPLHFIIALFPYFFGSYQHILYPYHFWGNKIGMLNISEYHLYGGILVYLLTGIAILFTFKKRLPRYYLFMTGFAVFMMLGRYNPLFKLAYYIPILNLFRSPCRYKLILNFSLAVCAAFGMDYLLKSSAQIKKGHFRFYAFITISLVMIICLWGFFLNKVFILQYLAYLNLQSRFLSKYAATLTLSNPAVHIPLGTFAVSFLVLFSPILVKRHDWYIKRFWKISLILFLAADLFVVNYFNTYRRDTHIMEKNVSVPLLQNVLRDKHARTMLESVPIIAEGHDRRIATLDPNINMIYGLRMATAEDYGLFSEDTRKILDLSEYGSNADIRNLLINNKILSSYAIKYLILNKYYDAAAAASHDVSMTYNTVALSHLAIDKEDESEPGLTFRATDETAIPIKLPNLSLQSRNGDWASRTNIVTLREKTAYEISFLAKAKSMAFLFVSVYSKKLEKNILLHSFKIIPDQLSPFSKIFITPQGIENGELHIYTKSETPLYLKNIVIQERPEADEKAEIFALLSRDGAWDGKSFPLRLASNSLYEILIEARGDSRALLYISVFAKSLNKNLAIYREYNLKQLWRPISKIIATDKAFPDCELHIYTKSRSPILIKLKHIKKLPYQKKANGIEQDSPYKIIKEDPKLGLVLLNNRNAMPLVYCVNKVEPLPSFNTFHRRAILKSATWNPAEKAFIEAQTCPRWKLGPGNCQPHITSEGANHIEIETQSKSNHFLVVGDTMMTGWQAEIDGLPTKIYKTNGTLKGIYLPRGSHVIKLKYTAPGFYLGLMISLVSLFSIASIQFKLTSKLKSSIVGMRNYLLNNLII